MAGTAHLAIRISAQIAEFQKAFAETNQTIVNFEKEFQKTSQQVNKIVADISAAFKSLGTAAGVMGAAIVGIGLAIAAAVAAFKVLEAAATAAFDFVKGAITDTAALGEQLFKLSNQVGVSVESLSALRFVAAQTDTSLETISAAVFKMSANLGKASKDTTAALAGIGLSLADLRKQAPEQAFASILQNINKLPSASAQAAAGMAIFGRSFKEISQLKGENLDELVKKAKELGLVMSTETAVAADLLGDKIGELQAQFEGLRQQIGAKLIPVVLTFVEVFGTIFSDAFAAAIQTFQGVGKSFDTFVVQIGNGVARVIEIFALMLDGIATWATSTILRTELVALAMVSLAESTLAAASAAAFLTGNFTVSAVFGALETKLTSIRQGLESVTEATLLGGAAVRRFATEVAAAAKGVDFGKAYQQVLADISKAADEMRKKLAAIGVGAKEGADAAVKALQTLVDQLSGKTILTEAIKWEAALKVVGREFHRLTDKDAKQFLGVVDEITDRFGSLEAAGVGGLKNISIALRALTQKGQTIELPIIPTLSTQTLAAVVAKAQPPQMILPIIPQMSDATLATIGVQISKARIDWAERARVFVEDLKRIGLDAAHGLAESLAVGIRTGDWSQLENSLKFVLSDALGAAAAAAVDFFVPGLGRALQPLFSALGDKILGWLGLGTKGRDAVKEFAASFGGFDALRARLLDLGDAGDELWRSLTQGVGRNNPEEAKRAIDAITQALDRADQGMKKFTDGAMARIKAFAASFKTAAGETAAALRKLIDAEMPELEMGIDEANARKALAGFADAIGGSRAEIQAEFQRLGLYAGTAFAETLRDEGLAAALAVAGPMFDELNALSAEFGLTLEGSAAQFAEFFRVAKENEDVVSALDAITQMVQGAGDAMFLTQELFSAFGADAVSQFDKLIERGVPLNQALALSQQSIQALWEAQARFGLETDAATQALIDQGVEQGIVGANMRDVNERILDVLLAIADVFNADIPAGLRATERQSRQTAQNMGRDFEETGRRAKAALQIDVPDIDVKVNFELGEVPELPNFDIPQLASGGIVRKPTLAVIGEAGPELVIPLQRLREMAFLDGLRDRYGIPGLQHGGIVRSPTLALIGEAGPEAVIPLSQMGGVAPGDTTVILEVDGRAFAEVMVPHIPGAVTRLGLGI
jgi:hypothetical protein